MEQTAILLLALGLLVVALQLQRLTRQVMKLADLIEVTLQLLSKILFLSSQTGKENLPKTPSELSGKLRQTKTLS